MAIVDFSYPYLRMSRKYGLPYEDILVLADYYTHGVHQPFHEHSQALRSMKLSRHDRLTHDLVAAAAEFHRIQREG